MCRVKKRFIALFFVTLMVYAGFVLAQTVTKTQEGQGGGISAGSANYVMKMAVADPGVGQSRSENYIYDHGTLWVSVAPPIGGGGGIGGIGGVGGGGISGGSGSGWEEPWVTAPTVAKVVATIQAIAPKAAMGSAVPQTQFPQVVQKILEKEFFVPQIIVAVDENNVVREMVIVLTKRVIPLPLWIAFILIILGLIFLTAFVISRGKNTHLLWIGGLLVVLGIVVGITARIIYRAEYAKDNFSAITDSVVVSRDQAGETVKNIMETLPVGAHRVIITGDSLSPQIMMTIYVKRILPI